MNNKKPRRRTLTQGVRQEMNDIDYWHKLPKNKYTTLPNGDKISIYDYMVKFMREAYGNEFDRENPDKNILQSEEHKSWAIRNNNNTNRDALLVSKKMGALNTLYQVTAGEYGNKREPWEQVFRDSDYEAAFHEAMKQSCDEVEIPFDKVGIKCILTIYFRINRFIKMVRKDMREHK